MLKPALLYKEEIQREFSNYIYDEDMFLYTGSLGFYTPNFENNDGGTLYQYAIVNNEKVIGYFTYHVDWYTSCANNFGLFSFDRGDKTVGIDVYREIRKLIRNYKIHRIEWRMISGNPVEKNYDKFCKRYNGSKHILKDALRDKQGNYHDDVIYEIILEEGS